MQKAWLCYRVDGIALVNLALLAATGSLLEFRLPPGSGGEHALQAGVEAGRHLTVWGLSRHEWGSIHFWLASSFLVLMSTHIFLHWQWIRVLTLGKEPTGQDVRTKRFLAFVGLVLLVLALPWLVPVKEKQRRRTVTTNAETRWEGALRQATEQAGLSRDRQQRASARAGADDTDSGESEGGNGNAGNGWHWSPW